MIISLFHINITEKVCPLDLNIFCDRLDATRYLQYVLTSQTTEVLPHGYSYHM